MKKILLSLNHTFIPLLEAHEKKTPKDLTDRTNVFCLFIVYAGALLRCAFFYFPMFTQPKRLTLLIIMVNQIGMKAG